MTDHTTPEGRAELRRVADRLSGEVPYRIDDCDLMDSVDCLAAQFEVESEGQDIVAAVNAFPSLIRDYERALARVAELEGRLTKLKDVAQEISERAFFRKSVGNYFVPGETMQSLRRELSVWGDSQCESDKEGTDA